MTKVKSVSKERYEKIFPPQRKKRKPIFDLIKHLNMKAMKDAVLTVAKRLAKANNTVTTLEIKTELRRDYPYYFWDQSTVSNYMSQFASDGIFSYTDNGTYRVYSLVSPKQAAKTAGPVSKQVLSKTITSAPAKRGRPRKSTFGMTRVNRTLAFQMAGDKAFESLTLNNGSVVSRATIRGQKKSPQGYLTPTKLQKVTKITVSGITYEVK